MVGLNEKTKTEKHWMSYIGNNFTHQLPIMQNYRNQNLDLKEVNTHVA